MIPCFKIPQTFNNNLSGEFIVLDIGGSTIRVGIVDLSNRESPILAQRQWLLSENDKIVDRAFFQQLVRKMIQLVRDVDESEKPTLWNIGITWSFPLNTLNEIITMGKGFTLTKEVVKVGIDGLITQICKDYGFNARVGAVINDSVAVNLSGLVDSDGVSSNISFILGTGLNSCILKDNELINTELGFFGKLKNVNKYDQVIDKRWNTMIEPYYENATGKDNVPIFQPLEFLASGRYISEILRLIIVDLIQEEGLLSFDINQFIEPFSLHGNFVCLLESSLSNELIKSGISKSYNIIITDEEIALLQAIIDVILERSATYISSSIQALAQFVEQDSNEIINVNYIGSFLFHCKEFQQKIQANSGGVIRLNHIEHSSLLGAAVAACIRNHP